jgi:hypothetical protein
MEYGHTQSDVIEKVLTDIVQVASNTADRIDASLANAQRPRDVNWSERASYRPRKTELQANRRDRT